MVLTIMNTKQRIFSAGILAVSAMVPVLLSAHSYGPPPGVTAAPGDNPIACTQCHGGTALNAGGGKVEILLAGDPTYIPGVRQHIQVKITDDPQRRWGFQVSARLAKDPANLQAGTLIPTPGKTQLYCSNYTPTSTGTPLPCATGAIQFLSHIAAGTQAGTQGPAILEFDWMPPDTDSGNVTIYVAANAANNNASSSGDHIYTTNVTLTPAKPLAPSVAAGSVVSAASYKASNVSPNSWLTIYGSNLASSTRTWRADELATGKLPTVLDGVSVTVNGKAAAVEYISPGQVNILTPDDTATGPVQVQVTTLGGTATPVSVTLQNAAPAFFTFDGKYLAATHADGTLLAAPGFFASPTTSAKPGETIVLYGTGFGATNPAASAGNLVTQISNCVGTPIVTIGGQSATVAFAGLIPGNAGLYQFNVVVPTTAAAGDQPVVAQLNGVLSPTGLVNISN